MKDVMGLSEHTPRVEGGTVFLRVGRTLLQLTRSKDGVRAIRYDADEKEVYAHTGASPLAALQGVLVTHRAPDHVWAQITADDFSSLLSAFITSRDLLRAKAERQAQETAVGKTFLGGLTNQTQ